MFFWRCYSAARGLAALLALSASSSATPTPVDVGIVKPEMDPAFRQALELASRPHLQKRLSADIDISTELNDEVLFSGTWTDAGSDVSLDVTCVKCWTKGSVTAKLTDDDVIDPAVRLEFDGVEAYVDLDLAMSGGSTYAVNLYTSDTPAGLGFPGLSVGVVFYVDLVFSLTDVVDLEAGFTARLADDAYLEASILHGDISDHSFDGITTKSLPITVKTGSATLKADLRLRVQVGAEAELLGIGAGAELGIYANVVEFVAVLETTSDCALQATEWWDLNVGAFAHLDVVVDYSTFGAVPTVSTTLLTAPTLTQCLLSSWPTATNGSQPAQPTKLVQAASGSPATYLLRTSPFESAPYKTAPFATGLGTPTGLAAATTGVVVPSMVPANASHSSPRGDELVTSTVYATSVHAITGCAVNVPNCPVAFQTEIIVTRTLDVFTTVCPASANITAPSPTPTPVRSSPASSVATAVFVTTNVVVLVPHPTPVVETFSAPANAVPQSSAHTITAAVHHRNPSESASPSSPPRLSGSKIPPWASESSKSTAAASAASSYNAGAFRAHETPATSAPAAAAAPRQFERRLALAGAALVALILI